MRFNGRGKTHELLSGLPAGTARSNIFPVMRRSPIAKKMNGNGTLAQAININEIKTTCKHIQGKMPVYKDVQQIAGTPEKPWATFQACQSTCPTEPTTKVQKSRDPGARVISRLAVSTYLDENSSLVSIMTFCFLVSVRLGILWITSNAR